ncbi:MAG: hypothetical protein C4532_16835 [Candidatus Abyssobacteria bacterium SURF_17]|jgi:hypothetical protein|uniref:Uncharacterized protein n=1 Tax=Candidatus Abyssobacteria bacterium SURF_17 TaxID=2093361 RepID=A0A419ERB8_9BACT|nr:MAG: hypothetical protein C4532_16835 [Candidatus Abyssubacteria bacterium SURF_17]
MPDNRWSATVGSPLGALPRYWSGLRIIFGSNRTCAVASLSQRGGKQAQAATKIAFGVFFWTLLLILCFVIFAYYL